MGVILDSTVFVGGEREGLTVSQILGKIQSAFRDTEIAMSAMTAVELVHGVWRAGRHEIRARREDFVDEVFSRVPVRSISLRTARIAGRIDAQSRSKGITIPTADLLIGATALELGFCLATSNARHFRIIPGLRVHLLNEKARGRPS